MDKMRTRIEDGVRDEREMRDVADGGWIWWNREMGVDSFPGTPAAGTASSRSGSRRCMKA